MQQRHLKIFISSTFKDMHDKRQKLITDVFVKFKKLAKQRGVEVTEIELRTGVSDATGHIAKVCLEQVDRCVDSPIFFLGMLGSYYGWDEWYEAEEKEHLKVSHHEIIEKYPKVSITELEIRYAIENPEHNQAFFYVSEPIADEDRRLVALKENLGTYAKERDNLSLDYYGNDDEFAQKVYADLERAFNQLYPDTQQPTELEKLRTSHQSFAMSRYKSYIPYDENEEILDEFLSSSNQEDRLLLYGESGLGKSALIANYFREYKKKKNDYFVIEHYIGGAGEISSNFYTMLQRVMLEIKEEFGVSDEVPMDNKAILDNFTEWLHKVKRKTIIIFDGYNQIEDEVKERFLEFYLSAKFENVKLIITVIKSNYKIANQKQIKRLSPKKQKEFIEGYLDNYGKKLTYDIDELLKHDMTQNTLFLRTLLEEIRLLGVYETIGEDIAEYLKSGDVKELFIKIFRRYERDYDSLLVREMLSLLFISRDGLSENNLLEIMEQKTEVDRYKFYPMLLAIEEHLVSRNRLYGFFHDYIKEAVESRYLPQKKYLNKYREDVASYFESRELDYQKVRELPYQLFALEDRERLYQALIDVEFFVGVQEMDEYELLGYVRFVDEGREFDISHRLANIVLNEKYQDNYIINEIANFFHTSYTQYKKSIILYHKSLEINEKNLGINHRKTAITYNNLAGVNKSIGNYDNALKFYSKSLKINKKDFHLNELNIAQNYTNLAEIYRIRGKYSLSLKLYKKTLLIREKKLGKNHQKTAIVYNNMALVYRTLGRFDKALELYEKAIEIYKKTLGEMHTTIAISYNNLGGLFRALKDYDKSLIYCVKGLKIREELLGLEHPATAQSLANLSEIYREAGDRDSVLPLALKALDIREKVLGEYHLDTAVSYNNLALIYTQNTEYSKALSFYNKVINIHKKILGEEHLATARSYNNLGVYYYFIQEYQNAFKYVKKAINIRAKILPDNHPELVSCQQNLKNIQDIIDDI